MRKFALAFILMVLPAEARSPFPPIDQGSSNSSFAAFRTKLVDIVARKDADAVLAIVDPDIHFSHGDEASRDGFAKEWELGGQRAKDSRLWGELDRVLSLGGSFGAEGAFEAPYVASRWPDGKEPSEHVAVITPGENVHAAPNPGSKIVYVASHEILRSPDRGEAQAWVKVGFARGRSGYIRTRAVRGPTDYRAIFGKANGDWRMKTFIAGD